MIVTAATLRAFLRGPDVRDHERPDPADLRSFATDGYATRFYVAPDHAAGARVARLLRRAFTDGAVRVENYGHQVVVNRHGAADVGPAPRMPGSFSVAPQSEVLVDTPPSEPESLWAWIVHAVVHGDPIGAHRSGEKIPHHMQIPLFYAGHLVLALPEPGARLRAYVVNPETRRLVESLIESESYA